MRVQLASCRTSLRPDAGFSFPEVLVVVALIAIIAGISIPVTRGMIVRAEADSATVVIVSTLNEARDRAIAERRDFQVNFVVPDRIQISRVPVPIGPVETVTNRLLENGQTIMRWPGVPDTPDAFGGGGEVNFTGPTPVTFTSDGSLVDAAGDPVNGTIFLATPDQPESVRAVSIFGMTGLARTWKWAGGRWLE
jgi:prepilin-type N-terminal cleavage/methylation domain-containing protein